jgi:ATP-dependent Clp protease adaptor protein ClpS
MPIGRPLVEEAVGTETSERLGRSWVVVVWDDPINLMSYVTLVLQRVFALPRAQAEQLMLKVHHEGRAVVASEPREQAELHVAQLHGYGLHATLERDV